MVLLVVLLALPISVLLNGWALSLLWGWFIVPVFGIADIGLGAAIGLSMVVSYLTYQYDAKSAMQGKEEILGGVISVLLRPVFAVLFGWIIQSLFVIGA